MKGGGGIVFYCYLQFGNSYTCRKTTMCLFEWNSYTFDQAAEHSIKVHSTCGTSNELQHTSAMTGRKVIQSEFSTLI